MQQLESEQDKGVVLSGLHEVQRNIDAIAGEIQKIYTLLHHHKVCFSLSKVCTWKHKWLLMRIGVGEHSHSKPMYAFPGIWNRSHNSTGSRSICATSWGRSWQFDARQKWTSRLIPEGAPSPWQNRFPCARTSPCTQDRNIFQQNSWRYTPASKPLSRSTYGEVKRKRDKNITEFNCLDNVLSDSWLSLAGHWSRKCNVSFSAFKLHSTRSITRTSAPKS